MYDKTKVFPIREPEGGGGGGDVTAAGNNTFTGVNTFENNVNLGKSDSIITVNGTLKDGGGNEYVTTTDVATKNSTGVVQIGDYIDVDENGVISSNDTRKASIEDLKDGTLVPKLADNLTPYAEDSGTTQTQPFFLEGTATGNGESRVDAKQVPAFAFLQEKRGNMVCVNQNVQNGTFEGTSGWDVTRGTLVANNNIGQYTITTIGGSDNESHRIGQYFDFIGNHYYLMCYYIKSPKSCIATVSAAVAGIPFTWGINVSANTKTSIIRIAQATSTTRSYLNFGFDGYNETHGFAVGDVIEFSNCNCIDLTQWFNNNIPSYLLSHPEAFGRYYKGSLAYEPGRLEPATGRYLTSVGRNIWDEEWEVGNFNTTTGAYISNTHGILSKNRIRCLGYTEYYGMCGTINVDVWAMFYDIAGNVIELPSITSITSNNVMRVSNRVFTTPATAYEMKFYATSNYGDVYKNDITISLYYPGESGYDKYYPHEVLANIDTGTETLYSAGTVYDSKVPSGLITRRIGSVDLGTLDYTYDTSGSRPYFYTVIQNKVVNTLNMSCSKYSVGETLYSTVDKTITSAQYHEAHQLTIYDSAYTDAASFKAAVSGLILNYELAEPTTEQGTPFQENIPIDDFGQLSWSNTDVPQGNQIFYPVDYKAYLDTLIKRTNGDATSLVRNTDYASYNKGGVGKVDPYFGVNVVNGIFQAVPSTNAQIKEGSYPYTPIVPSRQYRSVFYGLSRAAGVNLASSTEETAPDGTNPGVYPAAAKTAICNLIGAQSAVEVIRLI